MVFGLYYILPPWGQILAVLQSLSSQELQLVLLYFETLQDTPRQKQTSTDLYIKIYEVKFTVKFAN